MTSKHLLWNRWVQQNKRFLWIYIVNAILLFGVGPLTLLKDIVGIIDRKGMEGRRAVPEVALASVKFSFDFLWVVILLGVFVGIYSFSYLHSRKKLDFYHSQPVSERNRFFSISISGLLCFYVPYVLMIFMKLVIVKSYNGFTAEFFQGLLANAGIQMITYFAAYQLAALMTIITGNVIYSVLMTVVAILYEVILRKILVGFCGLFFENYFYLADAKKLQCKWSPIGAIMEKCDDYYWRVSSAKEIWQYAEHTFLWAMVLSVLIGVVCYVAYKKRPGETNGASIVFEKLRPIVKAGGTILVLCFSMDIYFEDNFYYNNSKGNWELFALALIIILVGMAICHIVFEFLWELDIREVRKHFVSTILAGSVTFLVFCSFYFDWYGYDSYVPDAEKVESVGIIVEDYCGSAVYGIEYMKLNCVEQACGIAKELSMAEKPREASVDSNEDILLVDFAFRMKNGDICYRTYKTTVKNGEVPFPEITNSEEYKRVVYPFVYDDESIGEIAKPIGDYLFWEDKSGMEISLNNCDSENLKKLQQALKADMKEYSNNTPYIFQYENTAIGRLTVNYMTASREQYSTQYLVFPEYTRTMECLQDLGVTTDSNTGFSMETIREVRLLSCEDDSSEQVITDLEQQRELLEKVRNNWQSLGNLSENIGCHLQIVFKNGNINYYFFNGEELPDWIGNVQ